MEYCNLGNVEVTARYVREARAIDWQNHKYRVVAQLDALSRDLTTSSKTPPLGPGIGPTPVRLRSQDLGQAARTHASLVGEPLDLGDVPSRPLRPRAPARVTLEVRRLIAGASYRRDPAEAQPDVDQFVGGQRPRLDALAGQSQPHGPSLGTGGLEERLDVSHGRSVQNGLATDPLHDANLGARRPDFRHLHPSVRT